MKELQKVNLLKKIAVVAQHSSYLIVNKPAGVLSQGSQKETEGHLIGHLEKWKKQKFHLLSRLDRPVSGLVMLSKTKAFNKYYQDLQDKGLIKKTYIAIVEGHVEKDEDTLNHFLCHDKKKLKSLIEDSPKPNFDPVELSFKCLHRLDKYSVLSTTILTGKFHQIRCQLAHYGHPIKGDVKYGARRGNKDRSISLHSFKIEFEDKSGKDICYEAKFPENDNLWDIVDEKID